MPPEAAKILVIDDSEDDRFLYRRVLRDTAYRVIEKDNGEDGLNCIGNERPACVLLDYSLPGRNGIEVLKRIRSREPFVPVVMLTGQGNEAVAVSAMREGAQHYIAKATITPDTLQRSIRIAIEYCNLQKRNSEQQASLQMFTRALAHDLKEPVRTIRSFLDLIVRQGFSEKTQTYFDYILRAAERMGALIDTVYFYMRLDNAGEMTREACDSAKALEDVRQNLDALIRERRAVITAEAMPMVQANYIQLVQVLQNLICNAIRHCEETPAIYVSAVRDEGWCLFRVTDNGPGIAPEYRERIFDPFKRLVHHKDDGLGLGLAICRKIIEANGGRIWCEEAAPHGTVFCFSFPEAEGVESASPVPVQEQLNAALRHQEETLASILMVEDNEADVELNRLALLEDRNLRCRLHIARNGGEALARLDEERQAGRGIDLVLLDINMPGMDGFEVLARMHEAPELQEMPVVMCSTSTYDKDVTQARQLGAAGYLTKPLDFTKLKPILENAPNLHLCEEEKGFALKRAAS